MTAQSTEDCQSYGHQQTANVAEGQLYRLRLAVSEFVDEAGRCTYLGHEGKRSTVDSECPGAWCFLSTALIESGGA